MPDLTKVLLIEDSRTDPFLIQVELTEAIRFSLEHVMCLEDGLEVLRSGAAIDVVLLDLNLPDSMGLKTFEKLHRSFPECPIVILSGHDDQQLAKSAVHQGAQDYLPKGVPPEILIRSLRYAIERNGRQLAERKILQTEQDMRFARLIQERLLPAAPPEIPGFELAAHCQPADDTGGDYFDFIPLADGRWDLVIADVTSHGFGPALIMAGTRRMLRTIAAMHDDVGDVLTIANRGVAEDTLEGQFVTMFLARLDPARRCLHYSAAGHDSFDLRANSEVTKLTGPYIPLGITEDSRYDTINTVELSSGDLLLLITDGVAEVRDPSGTLFGYDRVCDLVKDHRDKPPRQLVDTVLERVHAYCQPRRPSDDLTIVVAKVL